MRAALVSCAVQIRGRESQIIDRLSESPLSLATIEDARETVLGAPDLALNSAAEQVLQEDTQLAKRIDIRETPTVYIVKNADVFRLRSLGTIGIIPR
jgi:hypothetical protein